MNFYKFFICLIFTSCSLAGLFIGKADYFITDAIDDKLDLNNQQEKILEEKIAKLLNYIKPDVKKIIDSAQMELLEDEDKLYELLPSLTKTYLLVVDQFATLVLENLDLFTKEQKLVLNKELNKSLKKFEEKFEDNKFYKTIPERIEKFSGKLSKKQKKKFKAKKNIIKNWQAKKLEVNKLFFSKVTELIIKNKSPERDNDLLELKNNYFLTYINLYEEPEYIEIRKLIVQTLVNLDHKQKQHLQKEVKSIKEIGKKYLNYDYK